MAIKYDDIIKLRGGKAAYDIAEEKQGEWISFIPNEQFNSVLRTVIKSVRGNDIDNHKSFWAQLQISVAYFCSIGLYFLV